MSRYSIGLDLGTNSSGIAVVNEDFKIVKYKNKNMWSSMKFDEGKTAGERKSHRSIRRVTDRRKQRTANLRMLIGEEINKADQTFFQRLEESYKHLEDRTNKKDYYNLFIEEDFNDRHYYEKYPTIYHLREELIKDDSKKDIRLVYLALHHILKYRGNFLYEGENLDNISDNMDIQIEKLGELCSEHMDINGDINASAIINIINDKDKSRKDKVKEMCKLQDYAKYDKEAMQQVFNGILGLTMNVGKMNLDVSSEELLKIQMSDENIDEKISQLIVLLGDKAEVFSMIQKIYTKIKLNDVLNDKTYISEAMTAKYEKFGKELKMLKKLIRTSCGNDVYYKIFRSCENGVPNYTNYMSNSINSKKKTIEDGRKLFYEELKNCIKDIESEDASYIRDEINKGTFLIKLNTTANSVIPYQVHLKELDRILFNQGKYYDVLRSNADKIKSILTFRIPYYVGPLSKTKTEFSWMSRKPGMENEKIYPWNFTDVVDEDKSAEDFITRMTNYCSYLPSEPVLPFNSILYTEYLYYNEINKIRFNDSLLDSHEKEKLKKELFMSKNNVTEKDLMHWYKKSSAALSKDGVKVSGFMGDGKAAVTMKPVRDFTRIYGEINAGNIKEIEKIIYYLTVFNDKKIVKRKLDKEFSLNENAKKEILKLDYTGWARFSRRLLEGMVSKDATGRNSSIIDILRTTNLNFMQIINDKKYGFNKKIEEENGSDNIEKINYEKHIKPLQGSPAIKKTVYQAAKQIEEVIRLTGRYPENIFIEVAREDQESKRTLARNKKVLELYEKIEGKTSEDIEIIKKLKSDDKLKIDNERLYLYLMQRGKCMYSGKPLDINLLSYYEVDHIIPRSLVKNDSLSNKVLVIKEENQKKSSGALDSRIIDSMKPFWSELLKYGLIPKVKYDNLSNYKGSFSKEAEKGFINRQLVEVRQITTHVVNLFNRAYKEKGTKVYAIKAELVRDFKEQFGILKSREINDLHHAKDAYATAVVGMYIQKRFRNLDSEFLYDDYLKYKKEPAKRNKFGFIISSMLYDYVDEDGEVIWSAEDEISKIKKIFSCNNITVVKKPEIISGQMFNLTRCRKLSSDIDSSSKVALKNNSNEYLDPHKYGYYDGIQESYYSVIEFTKKNKRVKRIVGVPITYAEKVKSNPNALKNYFESIGYKDAIIIKDMIPKYQKILFEGDEFYLVSSGEWQNARQLKIAEKYYKQICLLNDRKKNKALKISDNDIVEIYDAIIKELKNNYKIYSSIVKKLDKGKDTFVTLERNGKIKIINEILKLSMANSSCADLKSIGGTGREGRIAGKSNIDAGNITFIYESFLGLNRRKVKY